MHLRACLPAGMLSGTFWNLGSVGGTVATLPPLGQGVGYPMSQAALLVSGVLFGAQHFQIGLLLPLSVTGFFWGVLYVYSGNLLVPILIHALWNARIFLGSYLGL